MKYIQQIFLGRNFFYGILSIVIFYVMGFYFPWIINLANFLLFAFILLILIDLYLLFSSKKGIEGQRILNEKLSNFDTNPVDRKSTRLNSSHVAISYAVFCLKKKTKRII